MEKFSSLDKARSIAGLALEKKGEDIVILDMTNQSAVCDWFVVLSAGSSRRMKGISDWIRENLSQRGILPLHTAGSKSQSWLLMDYDDVVVHIFNYQTRQFYNLEWLWSEAPRIKV